ncbi:aldehyde dehydrogenase family protein [Bradyrhizobium sp. USDA 3315]
MKIHDSKDAAAPLPFSSNIVGGASVGAVDGRMMNVLCPSDGKPFAQIARSGPEDVDRAVKAARHSFEGEWGKLNATERGRLLLKLSNEIAEHSPELATLESRDSGKPLSQGVADVVAAARYFEYYGTSADKLLGDTIPCHSSYTIAIVRDPHGVTGHIIPWTFSAHIFSRSVAASLACGNACVVKPAEDACLAVIRIAELARDVGFPAGALNVVAGLGSEAGAALAAHAGVNFISFTGTSQTGTAIQAAAARNNIGVTMELGGKSPQVIFADADIETAAPFVINGIIQNGGQGCSAASRILIERKAYNSFAKIIADCFSKVRVGAHQKDLDMGAMINAKQRDRVVDVVAKANNDGIEIIAEGMLDSEAPKTGFYVKPALFNNVPRHSVLANDEILGPVLALMPFDDEADAIALANGTPYGLEAGIWTSDAKCSIRVARAMRCSQVFVNGYGAPPNSYGVELPFGGVKRSGHGREKGFNALYDYCATKTIVINHG